MILVPKLERFVASVSFVREEGVEALATELKAKAKACTFFIGIRNDITSVQALRRLLELGVKVFCVDTASRSTLFHPKMFLSVAAGRASAIVGSANVTFSGLHNNIEASTVVTLDPANLGDSQFVKTCLDSFDKLPARFPEHVFQVKTVAAANELFDQGRLTDEEVIIVKPTVSSVRKGERDKLKPINLPRHNSPRRAKRIRAARRAARTASTTRALPAAPTPIAASRSAEFVLVWESKALTERDLNIPTGPTSNRTGSMLWKKEAVEGIDQRHFFRDEVFANITWEQDPKPRQSRRPTPIRARSSAITSASMTSSGPWPTRRRCRSITRAGVAKLGLNQSELPKIDEEFEAITEGEHLTRKENRAAWGGREMDGAKRSPQGAGVEGRRLDQAQGEVGRARSSGRESEADRSRLPCLRHGACSLPRFLRMI